MQGGGGVERLWINEYEFGRFVWLGGLCLVKEERYIDLYVLYYRSAALIELGRYLGGFMASMLGELGRREGGCLLESRGGGHWLLDFSNGWLELGLIWGTCIVLRVRGIGMRPNPSCTGGKGDAEFVGLISLARLPDNKEWASHDRKSGNEQNGNAR